MYALFKAIPDADIVVAMQPEELAGKILFLLKREGLICPYNIELELHQNHTDTYPREKVDQVSLALREAFAWLTGQGLLIPKQGDSSGLWVELSRRAQGFSGEPDFDAYRQAKRLDRSLLHTKIADPVWQAFVRGEYDVAVFQAMKAVETSVRAASGIEDIGVNLMRRAFNPATGPLTDMTMEAGEREARSALFAGAIGSYKNPHSHRDVDLEHPDEAIEIIMFANHLLRIVDARVSAMHS